MKCDQSVRVGLRIASTLKHDSLLTDPFYEAGSMENEAILVNVIAYDTYNKFKDLCMITQFAHKVVSTSVKRPYRVVTMSYER